MAGRILAEATSAAWLHQLEIFLVDLVHHDGSEELILQWEKFEDVRSRQNKQSRRCGATGMRDMTCIIVNSFELS
jgi:hypothetical protein